jgi:allantoin racemase
VKIKLVNPNTTASMTQMMGECARRVAAPGTEIRAANPPMGPPSIESWYDEALSLPGLLAEIAAGEREACDGYIVACFGDPGLFAAREIARGPVIGIAQAAMHAASLIAPSFAVVTTLSRTRGMAWHLADRYGMRSLCRSVRATDIPVLDLAVRGSAARQSIVEQCQAAVAVDGADAIVLGCAGMADLADEIADTIGVPVVDGVTAAVKLVEALVTLALTTAKHGEFARPIDKDYAGLLAPFSPRASPENHAAAGR